MPKLIIMQGLPASGKSTRAAEIMEDLGNTVRINKDLLRKMLHFDKWTPRNEKETHKASKTLAGMYLNFGLNVIIDDTNLKPGNVTLWQLLAEERNLPWEIVNMETPYEDCVDNNIGREGEVPRHVIDQMAFMSGRYPLPEKPFVVCDIDGTIADLTHRLKYGQPGPDKDWDMFFSLVHKDAPRTDIIARINEDRAAGHQVIFVSGRPERVRRETIHWMWRNGVVPGGEDPILFMRRDDDRRPDTQTKADIYTDYLYGYPIKHIYDDRPSVIGMWRGFGQTVIDVGNGIDF